MAKIPYWETKWSKLKGHDILRVPGSQFAALPATGKKNARVFSIFNVNDLVEIIQLRKSEVQQWLITKAKDEGVKPAGYMASAPRTPKRKKVVTPQIGGAKTRPLKNPKFKTGRGTKTGTGRGRVAQREKASYIIDQQSGGRGTLAKNPVRGRNYRKAVRLFRDFTGENPKFVDEWQVDVPDTAMQVGKVTGIMYKTRMDGREQEFLHEFSGKSRPILAASADGRQLLLLGGDYKMTERGIVDGSYTIEER